MAVVPNRYYNDPNLGAAFSSLAGLFAPASPQELVGYAEASAKKEEAARLATLFANAGKAGTPGFNREAFDAQGIAANLFDPSASYYAVDQGNLVDMRGQDVTARTTLAANELDNQTQRYGYDTTARTTLATNAADNQVDLVKAFYDSLAPGEVAPAVPGALVAPFGLPAIEERRGAPKPLSESEKMAELIAGLLPEEQKAIALKDIPVETIVGPDGKPQIVRRNDAVGQQDYVVEGSQAKAEILTARTTDGRTLPVRIDNGIPVDINTGQPVANVAALTKLGQPTGTNEEVGLTTGATGDVERRVLSGRQLRQRIAAVKRLIAANPSSQGLVGALRGTAQDIMQTTGELGSFFKGTTAEVADAIQKELIDLDMAKNFDPSLPAIDFYMNTLAWDYARYVSGDRVSNEQLRSAREALGGASIFANQANTTSRLDELDKTVMDDLSLLEGFTPGIRASAPVNIPGAPAVPGSAKRGVISTSAGDVTFEEVE